MHSCGLIAVALLFFISAVNGIGIDLRPPLRDLSAHEQHLSKRNLSSFLNSIPSQCSVQCDVITGAAHVCLYLDCLCTTDNSNALVTCVNCVVALTPYVDGIVEQYQLILDEWKNSQCAQFYTPPMKVAYPISTSSTPTSTATATPSSRSNDSNAIFVEWWLMIVLSIVDVALLLL